MKNKFLQILGTIIALGGVALTWFQLGAVEHATNVVDKEVMIGFLGLVITVLGVAILRRFSTIPKVALDLKKKYILLSIGYLDVDVYTLAIYDQKKKTFKTEVYRKLNFSETPTLNKTYVPRQTSETTAKGTVTKIELVPFVIE